MGRPRLMLHIARNLQWRRESQQPFQIARLALTTLLDAIVADLDNFPTSNGYILGGQTITLDDYLEIRPNARVNVDNLIKAGRLEIGPWFIIPYESLVSGESLVRNLEFGKLAADKRGIQCQAALLANTAGHADQLPQILQNFNISAVVVPLIDDLFTSPSSWSSRDGSQVVYVEAPTVPSSNSLKELGLLYRETKPEAENNTSTVLSLVQINPLADTYSVMQVLDDLPRTKELVIRSGTFSDFFEGIGPSSHLSHVASDVELDHVEYPVDTASTKIWIKQKNHSAEQILLRWAEPFSAWANLVILESTANTSSKPFLSSPAQIVDYAWEILLQNHSPEILSGAYVDDVDPEVDLRFTHVHQIGREITSRSLQILASIIDIEGSSADVLGSIIVFNPAPIEQSGLVATKIAPLGDTIELLLTDTEGNTVSSEQAINVGTGTPPTLTIRFVAEHVPPIGYRAYRFHAGSNSAGTVIDDTGTSIENEHLNIDLNSEDGTLSLFDKRTGRSFSGLNRFVDGGEAGDLRMHLAPHRDTLIEVATNSPLHVDRTISSVEQCLRTFQIFRIPESLNEEGDARLPLAAQFVPISVWTTIRLPRAVPRVDIDVTISNTARDHRLRVHFPTGIHTDSIFFESQFGVVEREVNYLYGRRWIHQGFVTVPGSNTGITIASRGLPEVELMQTDAGIELALTLLRCTDGVSLTSREYWTALTALGDESTAQAQCIGEYTFSYSLIPHSEDLLNAWQQVWAFQNPLDAVSEPPHSGNLPAWNSLVSSNNPNFVLSAVRANSASGGLLVRGYNLTNLSQVVHLHLGLPFKRAEKVRLDKSSVGETFKIHKTKGIEFTARPNEIITLLLIK